MTKRHEKPNFQMETIDPIGNLLQQTMKITPLSFGILIFIVNLLVDGWLGWHFDVFVSSSAISGLLQDLTALTTDFVVEPLVCGVYLWTRSGASKIFNQIYDSNVIGSGAWISKEIQHGQNLLRKNWVLMVILLITILLTINQIAAYMGWVPWRTLAGYLYIYPQMSFARAPFWFITIYGLCYSIWNVGVNLLILSRIFVGKSAQVIPLHPDNCGGLGYLSEFTTRVAFIVAPLGFYVSLGVIGEIRQNTLLIAYPVWLEVLAYLPKFCPN